MTCSLRRAFRHHHPNFYAQIASHLGRLTYATQVPCLRKSSSRCCNRA